MKNGYLMSEVRPVIFLNGPPRCGKDTLAEHIARTLPGFKVVKFSSILKERTHALYGRPDLPHDHFEETKDTANVLFLGLSPREAYIAVSELLLKQVHGKAVFGKLLLNTMRDEPESTRAFVISDSGFSQEAFPVFNHFGERNCVLIRIHSEGRGCTFEKDSRSYIDLPFKTIDIQNEGTEVEFLKDGMLKILDVLQSMEGGG
jgi:hypothetical protein